MTTVIQDIHTGELWVTYTTSLSWQRYIHIKSWVSFDVSHECHSIDICNYGYEDELYNHLSIQLDELTWINNPFYLSIYDGRGVLSDDQFKTIASYVDLLSCTFSTHNNHSEVYKSFKNQLLSLYPSLKTRLG